MKKVGWQQAINSAQVFLIKSGDAVITVEVGGGFEWVAAARGRQVALGSWSLSIHQWRRDSRIVGLMMCCESTYPRRCLDARTVSRQEKSPSSS